MQHIWLCGGGYTQAIMQTIKPKHRLTLTGQRHKHTHTNHTNLQTFGSSLTRRRPPSAVQSPSECVFPNHLITLSFPLALYHTFLHTFTHTTTTRCFHRASSAGSSPPLSNHQVSLDSHWSPEERDCNTFLGFTDLRSLRYYETSTSGG